MTRKYIGDYIGQPTPSYDSLQKVTGELVYTDDLYFPDMLWGKVLFSPHPHAIVKDIDTSDAEALPGVHAVITYKDSPKVKYNRISRWAQDTIPRTEMVIDREVRYIGDKVAAVAAETESIAQKAVSLIKVEYEILPYVLDTEKALEEGAPRVYPEGNLLKEQVTACGDVDGAFAESGIVVKQELSTSQIHHGAIEPHLCVGQWRRGDNLELWLPQQGVHRVQIILSQIFGIPHSKIQVHGMDIGGTFGGKDGVMLEPLTLLLSKKAGGRPVKIRYNRTESMVSTFCRHAMKLYGKMALTPEGKITAFHIDAYLDAGPYCGGSINVLSAMCGKMFKLYSVPNMRFHGRAVYTNGPIGGAMRGFGSPAIFAQLELLVNEAARRMGMDPVEFRKLNLIEPYDMDPAANDSLRSAEVQRCLAEGAEAFVWEAMKKECCELSNERYAYGCGVGTGLHGNGVAPFAPDITIAELMLHEDGSVLLRCGLTDHGAGTYTLMKQVVSETLQMPMDLVEITHSDTHNSPYDMGAGASRNTWTGASAVWAVSRQLRETMRGAAATLFECEEKDVVLSGGLFTANGKSATRADIAAYTYSVQKRKLQEVISYNSPHNAGSYGAHFAQVRVDKETGEVKVLKYLAMCDVGTPLNPTLLTGQLEGAILQGIGMALFEGFRVDGNGCVTNANLKKYRLPHAKDLPELTIRFIDNYEDGGPYGGKSVGESSIVPVVPAIVGAVNDALGTNLCHLPLTKEKILVALQKQNSIA